MKNATIRRLAAAASTALLLTACGNGDAPDESPDPSAEAPTEQAPGEAEGDDPAEEPEPADPAVRSNLYYGASELFLPEHPVDGYSVDFYASFDSVADISAWFGRNVDDFETFTIDEQEVNGEARWVASRDAGPGELARIEIAHSSAHSDQGFIAPIADVLPPDTTIIAVAFQE